MTGQLCTTCGKPAFPHPYRHPITVAAVDNTPMEPMSIELNGRQANELLGRIMHVIDGEDLSLLMGEQGEIDSPTGRIHPCDAGHLAGKILAAILEPIEPPDPERCIREAVSSQYGYHILAMLSGSEPENPSCSVCYEPIPPGGAVTDTDGKDWPIHRGACARHAGVPDDGFESAPYRRLYERGELMTEMNEADYERMTPEEVRDFTEGLTLHTDQAETLSNLHERGDDK